MPKLVFDYSHSDKQFFTSPDLLDNVFFDKEIKTCPWCKKATSKVHSAEHNENPPIDYSKRELNKWHYGGIDVYACECGWWSSQYDIREVTEYPENGIELPRCRLERSILREFDYQDIETPMASLIKYLQKSPKTMRDIHPKKMEQLVGSVFGNVMDCEVIHTGGSGDGGIDLYTIEKDSPLYIQVKKREKPTTESLAIVQRMIASTLLKGGSRACVVSTAKKFGRQSLHDAKKAVQMGILEEFELVDFSRFVSILNIAADDLCEPWEKYVQELLVKNKEI